MHHGRFSLFGAVCIGLLVLDGCNGPRLPETTPVNGTVLYLGKPVENATVIFSRGSRSIANGEIAIGKTDVDGKFSLTTHVGSQADVKGAVPGQYQVTVSKHVPPPSVSESEYKAMAEVVNEIAESGGMAAPDQQLPDTVELFPAKYSAAGQSELTAEVTSGQGNDFVFDLK